VAGQVDVRFDRVESLPFCNSPSMTINATRTIGFLPADIRRSSPGPFDAPMDESDSLLASNTAENYMSLNHDDDGTGDQELHLRLQSKYVVVILSS